MTYAQSLREFYNLPCYTLESRLDGLRQHYVRHTSAINAVKQTYASMVMAHWQADRIDYERVFEANGSTFVSFVAYAYGMVVYHGMARVTVA